MKVVTFVLQISRKLWRYYCHTIWSSVCAFDRRIWSLAVLTIKAQCQWIICSNLVGTRKVDDPLDVSRLVRPLSHSCSCLIICWLIAQQSVNDHCVITRPSSIHFTYYSIHQMAMFWVYYSTEGLFRNKVFEIDSSYSRCKVIHGYSRFTRQLRAMSDSIETKTVTFKILFDLWKNVVNAIAHNFLRKNCPWSFVLLLLLLLSLSLFVHERYINISTQSMQWKKTKTKH